MQNVKITTGHLSRFGAPTLFDMALMPVEETDKQFEICPPVVLKEYRNYQADLAARGLRQGMPFDELEQRITSSLASDAIRVQDACNLSGVVGAFANVLEVVWWLARKNGKGTDWVNNHYIARVWADKIASLTSIQSRHFNKKTSEAHERCADVASIQSEKGGDRG